MTGASRRALDRAVADLHAGHHERAVPEPDVVPDHQPVADEGKVVEDIRLEVLGPAWVFVVRVVADANLVVGDRVAPRTADARERIVAR